ncbi:MAG: class I SAM-dependent methyltransferase [Anaerolineae bacterium]
MLDLDFQGMALWLRMREWFRDPGAELAEAGVYEGQVVLDYGCGIGSYALPAARLVGSTGVVYALDIHPLAIQAVERRARKEDIANLQTICSDRDTGLLDGSLDLVLLYDVLHAVPDKRGLLTELHRVLKTSGRLLVKPDHLDELDFVPFMAETGLFRLASRQGETFAFNRLNGTERGDNGADHPDRG